MYTRNEKTKLFGMSLAMLLMLVFAQSSSVNAQTESNECQSRSNAVKIVTVEDYQGTDAVFNFPSDGVGHFSSAPLLSATIEVGGRQRTCVTARFSSETRPVDNYMVFQVRIDGVPMKGHVPGFFGIATPVVGDPEETDMNLERMVSHDFFATVEPGTHRIEVFFAGCCSAAPPPNSVYGYAGGAVLTLGYVKKRPPQ